MVNRKKYRTTPIVISLFVVTSLFLIFNAVQLNGLRSLSALGAEESFEGIIPTGVPNIYGEELGVSFDSVSASNPSIADATITRLGNIDRSITLEGKNLERYINILYTKENGISCEYCCGARSIIFADGKAACGCAHSYAMRGLAKYLLTEHGDEYTDEEILAEVGKWKILFFPTQLQNKARILESEGIETNTINLASNKYRDIEKGTTSAGGMVGGC